MQDQLEVKSEAAESRIIPRCLVALPLDIEEILKAFEEQGL